VRAHIANPENTGEVFKIIQAMKGGSLGHPPFIAMVHYIST
jgi:hypothetical protein